MTEYIWISHSHSFYWMCNHNPELTARSYPSRSPMAPFAKAKCPPSSPAQFVHRLLKDHPPAVTKVQQYPQEAGFGVAVCSINMISIFIWTIRSGLQNNATGVVFTRPHAISFCWVAERTMATIGSSWWPVSWLQAALDCPWHGPRNLFAVKWSVTIVTY